MFEKGDKVKIIGRKADNGDLNKTGEITRKEPITRRGVDTYFYTVRGWAVYEEDLELVESSKSSSSINKNISSSSFCSCNGPSKLQRYTTFEFYLCLKCGKEKR